MFPSSPILLGYLVVGTAVASYLYQKYALPRRAVLPLPPGPKPLPVLGNILDMPSAREYEKYAQWGKEYGDVVHVQALGTHIIVLNSIKAATELLDQRSAIYSDRPQVPMLHESNLMDMGWTFVLKPYSPSWKRHRRLFAQYVSPVATRTFRDRQLTSTHTLLRSLLRTPEDFRAHLKYTTANIILGIAYGYDVQPTNDPLVEIADRMAREVGQAMIPGRYLVNFFPWLNYVPAWFPGTGFKAFAAEARKSSQDLFKVPFESLKTRMTEGTVRPSFVATALADVTEKSDPEIAKDIMEVAATMYGTGADTTVACLHTCILALTLNPAVQHRAHAELDAILGTPTCATFRLPTYDDLPNFPFIDAILKESLRWITVIGTGIPHMTTEEDEYRGWRIPKGSIVFANAWGMLRDENTYLDPHAFRPERFLLSNGGIRAPDPGNSGAFGFGRRACPGRHLAEASLSIQIANLLAAFTFSPAKDKEGREIDIHYAATPEPGFILHPQSFRCLIMPRSKEVEARIRETSWTSDDT